MFSIEHVQKTNDCTNESRKDETYLQFKMKKHYIKTWKFSLEHALYITHDKKYNFMTRNQNAYAQMWVAGTVPELPSQCDH